MLKKGLSFIRSVVTTSGKNVQDKSQIRWLTLGKVCAQEAKPSAVPANNEDTDIKMTDEKKRVSFQKDIGSSSFASPGIFEVEDSPLISNIDEPAADIDNINAFNGLNNLPCAQDLGYSSPEPQYGNITSGYELFNYDEKFHMKHGKGVLPEFNIAYETWGELNETKSNAVMLYTGLSASSHASSHEVNPDPGWWEKFIAPGSAIDTNKFFVICTNNLGGCFGSTGPWAMNPETGKPYGSTFPIVTIEDMARTTFLLLDHLGIDKVYASIGSSMGAMLSLTSAVLFPERVERVISISGTMKTHPSTIALRYLQRKAIMMDPDWHEGHYYDRETFPMKGMQLAREIASVTYRSGQEWERRFGRKPIAEGEPNLCPYFMIEDYIAHQGKKFRTQYDANSLIYISKAMDLFDLSDMSALERVECPVMVMGVKTDTLIPVTQQREMADKLRDAGNNKVTYYELDSIYGHDTFLLDLNGVGAGVKGFMETKMSANGKATAK